MLCVYRRVKMTIKTQKNVTISLKYESKQQKIALTHNKIETTNIDSTAKDFNASPSKNEQIQKAQGAGCCSIPAEQPDDFTSWVEDTS